MLSFYDSRTLAKKLDIPLARFKRWAREFLPPDNLGGFQSGYARQYNVNEAFKVYFGGFLVHEAKLSMTQAQYVMAQVQNRLPNLYSSLKSEEVGGIKLALVVNPQNKVFWQMHNGARLVYEDDGFEDNVKDFVRVVLVGKLILRFAAALDSV